MHCSQSSCNQRKDCYRYWLGQEMKNHGWEYTATIKCVDIRKCEVEIEYKTYWKKLRAFNYDPHNRLGFTSIETQVEYVHELQHILKVMKVDKELELLKERRSNQ